MNNFAQIESKCNKRFIILDRLKTEIVKLNSKNYESSTVEFELVLITFRFPLKEKVY